MINITSLISAFNITTHFPSKYNKDITSISFSCKGKRCLRGGNYLKLCIYSNNKLIES